jgi:hypothetical protein
MKVPAVVLFFLSPLLAEFLLGNLPITMLPALLVLAPLYGGGALLIREAVRHTRRGWPSIFLLGLVYAVFEEAITTQSLFNPDYLKLNLRLLDPAYIPALGIGAWWTIFVLTLHTVWSIATPIALSEALVPNQSTTPWLGRIGMVVTGALFVFGAVATTHLTLKNDRFMASPWQFASAAILCVALTVVAFRLPKSMSARPSGRVPNPWLAGAGALAAGSCFMLIPQKWGWGAVAAYFILDFLMIVVASRWSRREGWNGRHRLGLAGGAALTYAWHAFLQPPVIGGDRKIILMGNALFALGAVVFLMIAARRQTHPLPRQELPGDPGSKNHQLP